MLSLGTSCSLPLIYRKLEILQVCPHMSEQLRSLAETRTYNQMDIQKYPNFDCVIKKRMYKLDNVLCSSHTQARCVYFQISIWLFVQVSSLYFLLIVVWVAKWQCTHLTSSLKLATATTVIYQGHQGKGWVLDPLSRNDVRRPAFAQCTT